MRTQRLAVFAALAILGITSTAAAQTPPTPIRITRQHVSHHSTSRVCRHRNKRHHLVRVRCPKKHKPTAHANTPAPVPTVSTPVAVVPLAAPSVIGVGHTPGCIQGADPTSYLRLEHASIMRVIINPDTGADGSALPCIQAAVAGGYKVNLDIQWWNPMKLEQVRAFFRSTLAIYGPYASAVAVGNEQELGQGGPGLNGADYSTVWKAVEPIVATMAPHAVRVAGEISPWGLSFLVEALNDGLPGVQALSAHPYYSATSSTPAQFLALAGVWHLPMWFTEALASYDAYNPPADLTPQQMAGALSAYVWLS